MPDTKVIRKCPNDAKHVVGDAEFCPKCGTKTEVVQPEKIEEPKINTLVLLRSVCPNDAKHVVGDAEFCPKCGAKLVNPLKTIVTDRLAVEALPPTNREKLIFDALAQIYLAIATIENQLKDLHPGGPQSDREWLNEGFGRIGRALFHSQQADKSAEVKKTETK